MRSGVAVTSAGNGYPECFLTHSSARRHSASQAPEQTTSSSVPSTSGTAHRVSGTVAHPTAPTIANTVIRATVVFQPGFIVARGACEMRASSRSELTMTRWTHGADSDLEVQGHLFRRIGTGSPDPETDPDHPPRETDRQDHPSSPKPGVALAWFDEGLGRDPRRRHRAGTGTFRVRKRLDQPSTGKSRHDTPRFPGREVREDDLRRRTFGI